MEKQLVEIEPNVWKPEKEGDEIQGVLVNVSQSKRYENKVYHIETTEGQKVVFGTTVLDDRMAYVKVSEFVKIIYKHTEKNSRGQDTKIFKVLKEKS